jgi:hypothetical protein
MAGKRKPKPIEIFELTIADAERAKRMRRELRDKFGEAMRINSGERDKLDCLESDDLFVIFKPNSRLGRADFTDARPLLRQALVAACAAFETYLADKAMTKVTPLLAGEATLTADCENCHSR